MFPGWALKREVARLQFDLVSSNRRFLSTYEAAEKSRTTDDWSSKNRSADGAIIPDYWTFTARARSAMRDDWSAASIADGYVRHVVGTGITPRANARDPKTGASLTEFNRQADALWKRWARDPRLCDKERSKTFVGIQQLAAREMVAAGQAFVLLSYEPRPDAPGLVLQMFEPEQLDQSLTSWRDDATGITNDIRNGIEIDDYGAAVAYHVYLGRHPFDSYPAPSKIGGRTYRDSARIPADRVIHLMRQDRVRQTQGVTRLAPVLRTMYHTKMYDEYALHRAKFEACGGATIETDVNASAASVLGTLTGQSSDTTDANENKQLNFEPSMVWELPAGKRVNFLDPKVPSGQHEPYMRSQIKKIAAGAGLDYPTVSRDFAGNTFAGQRQGMIETWGETDPEQQRMIDVLCARVWSEFISVSVLEQRLSAPAWYAGIEYRTAYCEASWQPPAKPWIDPQNQANAAATMKELNLISDRDLYNERGENWREGYQEIAEEKTERKRLGIETSEPAPAPPVGAFGANRIGNIVTVGTNGGMHR
jgi:lambda family phage portal protein